MVAIMGWAKFGWGSRIKLAICAMIGSTIKIQLYVVYCVQGKGIRVIRNRIYKCIWIKSFEMYNMGMANGMFASKISRQAADSRKSSLILFMVMRKLSVLPLHLLFKIIKFLKLRELYWIWVFLCCSSWPPMWKCIVCIDLCRRFHLKLSRKLISKNQTMPLIVQNTERYILLSFRARRKSMRSWGRWHG